MKKEQTLLQHVETIAISARNSKLSATFKRYVKPACIVLAQYLHCTQMQCIWFAIICNLKFRRAYVDIDDLANYLDISPISIIAHLPEMDKLAERRILRKIMVKDDHRNRLCSKLERYKYTPNPLLIDLMVKGLPFKLTCPDITDVFGFLEAMNTLHEEKVESLLTLDELFNEVISLVKRTSHHSFAKALVSEKLDPDCIYLYGSLCYDLAYGQDSAPLTKTLDSLYDSARKKVTVRAQLMNGTHPLITKDLITLGDEEFVCDREISLTQKGISLLFMELEQNFSRKKTYQALNIVTATSIPPKKLLFNDDFQHQLDALTQYLLPGTYEGIKKRMKSAGMSSGIAVLLHGPPGTGKTETVLQIARTTGRDIRMVNISEIKSKYYSESEKQLKKLFDQYKREVNFSKTSPLLLFNEADAVFSSRKSGGHSAVDQTEHLLQNLLLNEMEWFEGILMATTNFARHIDPAYERRFLFKLEFQKPNDETKGQIWQSKFPWLPPEEVLMLAKRFDFNPGQIENILKKQTLNYLLNGTDPDLETVLLYCHQERIETPQRNMIGFGV